MPRKKRLRKIVEPPKFKSYKPTGLSLKKKGDVELLYEEYEAIRLADYDLMNHKEASVLMGISRPTFARIYESARRKIALAFVEAKEIKAVYGNSWIDNSWFSCGECECKFTLPPNINRQACPMCGNENYVSYTTNK